MDIFMDRLSQRATAQEIINANTAADVEELNRWKKQAADYGECLSKMHKLVDEGLTKLACCQVENEEWNRLAERNADGIRVLQEELGGVRQRLNQLQDQMEFLVQAMAEKTGSQSSPEIMERLDAIEENVHKECVKVYRNVQAVLVEEGAKQGSDVDRTKAHVKQLKGKVTVVEVCSILAAVGAMAAVAIQVLTMMGILVF